MYDAIKKKTKRLFSAVINIYKKCESKFLSASWRLETFAFSSNGRYGSSTECQQAQSPQF